MSNTEIKINNSLLDISASTNPEVDESSKPEVAATNALSVPMAPTAPETTSKSSLCGDDDDDEIEVVADKLDAVKLEDEEGKKDSDEQPEAANEIPEPPEPHYVPYPSWSYYDNYDEDEWDEGKLDEDDEDNYWHVEHRMKRHYDFIFKKYGPFSFYNDRESYRSLNLTTMRDEATGDTVVYDRIFNNFILESQSPKKWTVQFCFISRDEQGKEHYAPAGNVYYYRKPDVKTWRVVLPRIHFEKLEKSTMVGAYCIYCCGAYFPVDPERIYQMNPFGVYPAYSLPKEKSHKLIRGCGVDNAVQQVTSVYAGGSWIPSCCYKTTKIAGNREYLAWLNNNHGY